MHHLIIHLGRKVAFVRSIVRNALYVARITLNIAYWVTNTCYILYLNETHELISELLGVIENYDSAG